MNMLKILPLMALLIKLTLSTMGKSTSTCNDIDLEASRSDSFSAVVPGKIQSSSVSFPHRKPCVKVEQWPLSLHENDEVALGAIQILHWQMDDDRNGDIDLLESDEFLREELQYKQGCQKRHRNFHRNNDSHISVMELWTNWMNSQVHDWTINQTAEWVATVVELPEYQEKFRQLQINGTYLPRLAVNHCHFLTVYLGMKDATSKLKLSLKAKDVVLFGTSKDSCYHRKDTIFIVLVAVTISLSYCVYCRYVRMLDWKALIQSEELLRNLKVELEQAKRDLQVQRCESSDRFVGAEQIKDAAEISEIHKLQEEVNRLQAMLQKTEVELHLKCWVAPPELIYWLKVTYDLEVIEHSRKQDEAEKLLRKASNACEKLRKRRNSFINAFFPIHSCSKNDDVDITLLNARKALEELTEEISERRHRWHKIETLLNRDVVEDDHRSQSVSSFYLQ